MKTRPSGIKGVCSRWGEHDPISLSVRQVRPEPQGVMNCRLPSPSQIPPMKWPMCKELEIEPILWFCSILGAQHSLALPAPNQIQPLLVPL